MRIVRRDRISLCKLSPTKIQITIIQQDIESFDLEDFKYNNVNITAFRLVDIKSKRATDIIDQMKIVQKNSGLDVINDSSIMQVIMHRAPVSDFQLKHCTLWCQTIGNELVCVCVSLQCLNWKA